MKTTLKRGQIVRADLGTNRGSEINKERYCYVVQNDMGNKFAPTTILIPITDRPNRGQPTQIQITPDILGEGSANIYGMILTEQVRTVDKCRIREVVGSLNKTGIQLVDRAILISMGIDVVIKKEA